MTLRIFPKVREVLPEVMARLRAEWFDPEQAPLRLEMAAYHDDGVALPHRDADPPFGGICYFHRLPKPFLGGDLLLYDTDTAKGGYSPQGFSRIEPTANSIVFYPPDHFHEVTPVAVETGDFADGRFAVNVTIMAAPRRGRRLPP